MSNNKTILNKTIPLSIVFIVVASLSTTTFSAEKKMEKCTGIVKAGKADGQQLIKGKKVDWILVPAGACLKFVGGKVILDK